MSEEGKVGEMKPCPFCGGDAEYDSDRWNGMRPVQTNCGHAIYCSKCPLPDVGGTPIFETKEEAVEYWNRRAPTPSADGASVVVPVDLVQRAVIALQEVGQQAFAVDLLNTLRPHAQFPTRKGYAAVNEAFRRAESEKTILKQTIREMNTPPVPAGDAEAMKAAKAEEREAIIALAQQHIKEGEEGCWWSLHPLIEAIRARAPKPEGSAE